MEGPGYVVGGSAEVGKWDRRINTAMHHLPRATLKFRQAFYRVFKNENGGEGVRGKC